MNTSPNQKSSTRTNKPSHIAFAVRPGNENQKAFWSECGVAWPHKDGKGFRIKLASVPVNGIIELRVNEPKPSAQASGIDWTDFSDCEG